MSFCECSQNKIMSMFALQRGNILFVHWIALDIRAIDHGEREREREREISGDQCWGVWPDLIMASIYFKRGAQRLILSRRTTHAQRFSDTDNEIMTELFRIASQHFASPLAKFNASSLAPTLSTALSFLRTLKKDAITSTCILEAQHYTDL